MPYPPSDSDSDRNAFLLGCAAKFQLGKFRARAWMETGVIFDCDRQNI